MALALVLALITAAIACATYALAILAAIHRDIDAQALDDAGDEMSDPDGAVIHNGASDT